MPISSHDALRYFRSAEFTLLNIEPEHAVEVEALPAFHAAPFDRLLIAQALTESLRLITHDSLVAGYSESIILV